MGLVRVSGHRWMDVDGRHGAEYIVHNIMAVS